MEVDGSKVANIPKGYVKSDTESKGYEPDRTQLSLFEHFCWFFLRSDSGIILNKCLVSLVIGGAWYLLGTLSIWAFFATTVVFPAFLFVIHFITYNIQGEDKMFVPEFVCKTILVRVKYITFMLQNLAICFVYWYGDDDAMSWLVTFAMRTNVFEVFLDICRDRRFLYYIPSIMLMLPLPSSRTTMFPHARMHIHDRFIMVWEPYDLWFIVMYTGWFVGWIIPKSDRVMFVLHTIFPLFAPPELWFSVRTLTGSFLLWWLYVKPLRFLTFSWESQTQRKAFSEIYDVVYVLLFLSCYVMSGLMRTNWEGFNRVE